MVEAVHIVYSTKDKTIFSHVNIEEYVNDDELDLRIFDNVDLRRYTELPPQIDLLPDTERVLPNLQRYTIASWLMYDSWNAGTLCRPSHHAFQHLDSSLAFGDFDGYVGSSMPVFASRFMCRQPCEGPLSECLAYTYIPDVNALHDIDLSSYGHHLIAGTRNIIHIEQRSGDETPLSNLTDHMGLIVSGLADVLDRWTQSYKDAPGILKRTSFTYIIHRDMEYDWPDFSTQAYEEEKIHLGQLTQEFQQLLDPDDDGCMDMWIGKWSIKWEDDYSGCPACRLGVFDMEVLEEDMYNQGLSDMSTEPETP
jgi:hypothetical protein